MWIKEHYNQNTFTVINFSGKVKNIKAPAGLVLMTYKVLNALTHRTTLLVTISEKIKLI